MTRLVLAAFAALAGGALSYSIPREQAQLRGPPELPVPTRPLEWGDINFLSTSATHGEAHAERGANRRLAPWTPARKKWRGGALMAEHLARARRLGGKSR